MVALYLRAIFATDERSTTTAGRVLRRWQQAGHLPPAIGGPRSHGDRPARLEPAYASPKGVVT